MRSIGLLCGRWVRRTWCFGSVVVVATLATLLVPVAVPAQDSEAPDGASVRWLPCERWVMLHWLPYDERRLFRMLRISRAQARDWIADDQHHTFGQLVRRRGLGLKIAARRLVAPWTRRMSDERRALLRERALRTLTQGHLSQHLFFHVFHHPDVGAHARRVFHTSPMHYFFLRHAGYTPAEIGAIGGRARRATAKAIARVWRAAARRGTARKETPAAQARRFADQQLARLQDYLDSSIAARKPGPPPPPPRQATRRPRLRLLCTIFGGRRRAQDLRNYGDEALWGVVRAPALFGLERLDGTSREAGPAEESNDVRTVASAWTCPMPARRFAAHDSSPV